MKKFILLSLLFPLLLQAQAPTAQTTQSNDSFLQAIDIDGQPQPPIRPQYRAAQLDILLQDIGERTGKVILKDPAVQEVPITLVSNKPMPVSEFLKAAESILTMNNIALIPFRDDFIKVVPSAGVERSGVPILLNPNDEQGDEAQVISQVISLKHLDYTEVQGLITERLSQSAKVQIMERNNSLLITDTRANIGSIQKILQVLDQPAEVREAVKIYQLANASAEDVKTRLESLIEQSQAQAGTTDRQNTAVPVTPRGLIRPGRNNNETQTSTTTNDSTGGTAPGLIQGSVQIVADERTNVLMIISRPENDAFFEEMIGALDKKVDPEVVVRIHNLQFADAEIVSATLNELIGAASEDQDGPEVDRSTTNGVRSGQSVRDFIRQEAVNTPESTSATTAQNISRMGENTRILPDIRSNALILMGRNQDLEVIESVIQKLDIMLAQVAVRAVIMEVILNDNISYGVDWLQRSLTVSNVDNVNGVPVSEPVFSFAGGQRLQTPTIEFPELTEIGSDLNLNPGGLSYFSTFYDFNLDVIIQLAQSNSQAKVIATPIIVTTDNTEASIRVGERRAVPTTTATTIGGSVQSSYEYQDIGLHLSITPRINPQGIVILEITQTAENVAGNTSIDGNEVPIITSRELEASVAIRSGGTLALGGLVREDNRDAVSKVPILGDIPIIGALFRSTSKETTRTELLVLISPEVLVTTEEAENLTRELKSATELNNADWHRGWNLPPKEEWGVKDGPDAGPGTVAD
ncbi:type II secretion system secretin GspD [Kiritimatiellota bacterium B12222]|nr:type II secretion system secretin GspD [Kiritimatiellota bacterium B12222]